MYLSFIDNRSRGHSSINQTLPRTPVSLSLLERLRSHQAEEYLICDGTDEDAPPLACSFSKERSSGHVLAVVDENGSVNLYNTNKATNAHMTGWLAHNNAVFDLAWLPGEGKLLTAAGDQTVALWDVHSRKRLLTCGGHTSSVRSVGLQPYNNAVFASGSRDGHIRLWDTRCNLKEGKTSSVNIIRNAHMLPTKPNSKRQKSRSKTETQDSQQSVTCVVYQNDHSLTSVGAVDGCVKVWDTRKLRPSGNSTPCYTIPYSGSSTRTRGYSSIAFDSHYSRLYASCMDDVIYCYDFSTYNPKPVCTYRGHENNASFYIKAVICPDDKFLFSGSGDGHAYIWKIDEPTASPVLLKGHSKEVSDVAWCQTDLFRMATISDDSLMRVWRYDPTVDLRARKGQSDAMCGLTGFAERSHRDIGVSVSDVWRSGHPPTPKRSASEPVIGSVTAHTPKRLRVSVATQQTPERAETLTTEHTPKRIKLSTPTANLPNSVDKVAPKRSTTSTEHTPKRIKTFLSTEHTPKRLKTSLSTELTPTLRSIFLSTERTPNRLKTSESTENTPERLIASKSTNSTPKRRRTSVSTERTPKRLKKSVSSPSPSIKHWLKRSVSDPSNEGESCNSENICPSSKKNRKLDYHEANCSDLSISVQSDSFKLVKSSSQDDANSNSQGFEVKSSSSCTDGSLRLSVSCNTSDSDEERPTMKWKTDTERCTYRAANSVSPCPSIKEWLKTATPNKPQNNI